MTVIMRHSYFLVVATVLAGFAFPFAAQAQMADTVVAELNGEAVTWGEIAAFQQTIPSATDLDIAQVLPQLLNFYIDQKLIMDAARGRGLENDPQVKEQLARLEIELICQAFLRDEITDRVTPERIQEAYSKRMETAVQEDEVKTRHILVETQDDAEALLTDLNDGADFAALAQERSTGQSGPQGSDLGWFIAGTMVPEFAEAAFALEPGQISPSPVQTDFGWHVILVEDRRQKPLPTLDEIRAQLRDELADDAVQDVMTELRGRATIDIKPSPTAP